MSNPRTPVTGDLIRRPSDTTDQESMRTPAGVDARVVDEELRATVVDREPSVGADYRSYATFSSIVDVEAGPETVPSVDAPTEEVPVPRAEGLGLPDRYEVLSRLGEGGMGEVWKARDRVLGRAVAVKVVRAPLLTSKRGLQRFREEAQIAAQLEHPGIVPVHDLGVAPDGRLWFTMKEVRGRTLETLLLQVHKAWRMGHTSAPGQMTFRRMLDAFLRVCETVGFAHSRGVVHRDLKPANIMVGDHGEIMVLDWGLAKVLTAEEIQLSEEDRIQGLEGRARTRMGAVSGTPAYMPPEQARGQVHKIGPAADVYALGATLYDLLTERPPYVSPTVEKLLDSVISAERIPKPSEVGRGHPIDEELDRICLKALAHHPEDRHADAGELAEDISQWLDGAKKREQALKLIHLATQAKKRAVDAERSASLLEASVKSQLAALPGNAPEGEKWPAWDAEDEARRKRREAQDERIAMSQHVHSALSVVPDLREAHAMLAEEYHRQHVALESTGRREEARGLEALLRSHDRGRYAPYLKGEGALTLVTDVEADVELFRYETVRRRLQPVPAGKLGTTPLKKVSLPMGSWLLVLRAPGRVDVRYPVLIGREEHWDGAPPGEDDPFPIAMPKRGTLGPDDVYVPAGRFWSSADLPQLTDPLPRRRLWCDAFVMGRFPVTNREYLQFLESLVRSGREEEALRWVPRQRGRPGELGAMIYGRRPDGGFQLQADTEGSMWRPEMPVVMVSAEAGAAYGAWRGPGWRLPMELEWEKAARGVDERTYPWGDGVDPAWARFTGSLPAAFGPVEVDTFPADVSPYGVRGLAGNVSDWVADPRPGGAEVVGGQVSVAPVHPAMERRFRGGNWNSGAFFCRSDIRRFSAGPSDHVGLRISRSFSTHV
jgi:serine/threonine protein kinase/formylglycine-generating enzyme required for sulfatase activity